MPAETTSHPKPLVLDGLKERIVELGLRGAPLDEQLSDFCQQIFEAGFPMRRAGMGMGTLHPRYGAHTYVWRPGRGWIDHRPRPLTLDELEAYKRSPIHYMRSRGETLMRRRLDNNQPFEFELLDELRAEGMTEYAAALVAYDPDSTFATRRELDDPSMRVAARQDGIFFSCATDLPTGFDDNQLIQVTELLPFVALALKARATYDVATTVIATYLGEDAARRVLTGEIRRGSVESIRAVLWFSDLRGFTHLADTLPETELIDTLDDYLEAMARPVRDHGGEILKFLGDGFLAVFDLTGLEDASVCHSSLAAAMQLRSGMATFNDERRAAGKPVMDFGLALHLGDVAYGNIGASDRLDFTVVGPAVNEASRIQALCRPLGRDVLVSRTFFDAATECRHVLSSLGMQALRGVREPQELFELEGPQL